VSFGCEPVSFAEPFSGSSGDDSLPRGGKVGSLPRGGNVSSLPRGGNDSSLPRGGNDESLPRGGKLASLPRGGNVVSLPRGGSDLSFPRPENLSFGTTWDPATNAGDNIANAIIKINRFIVYSYHHAYKITDQGLQREL